MIQVIEDDLLTCHIITALLKRMQLPWCQAHTGEEALGQLGTLPIELVIMDMVLPDAHGLELLERKHSLPAVSDIPVLCCTADADPQTIEAAMGFGAVDFIKKPIVVPVFSARVSRAMEQAPVRWELDDQQPHAPVRTGQPTLIAASHILHELDDALALAQREPITVSELNAMVGRARGAAVSAGAARTVQQLDRLWRGTGTYEEVDAVRAALVIELAAFDEAIHAGIVQPELTIVSS